MTFITINGCRINPKTLSYWKEAKINSDSLGTMVVLTNGSTLFLDVALDHFDLIIRALTEE